MVINLLVFHMIQNIILSLIQKEGYDVKLIKPQSIEQIINLIKYDRSGNQTWEQFKYDRTKIQIIINAYNLRDNKRHESNKLQSGFRLIRI